MDIKNNLEEYDDSFYRIKEDTPIFILNGKTTTIHDYLYGKCHLFALAYAEATNSEIGVFISSVHKYESDYNQSLYDQYKEYEMIDVLDHAFCYTDDKELVIDIKGLNYLSELEAEYCSDSLNYEELQVGKTIILDWISKGKLADFKDNEKSLLITFIQEQFLVNNLNKKQDFNIDNDIEVNSIINETKEPLKSIDIQKFILKETIRISIQKIMKDHKEYDFNDPKSIQNMCSYFNIKVMEALKKAGYESNALLLKIEDYKLENDCILKTFKSKHFHNHNVTQVDNFIIDLTKSQFGNIIQDYIMEADDYLKKFHIQHKTPSKKLNLKL